MLSYEICTRLRDAGFQQDEGLLLAEEDKEKWGWFTCEGRGDAYIDKELVKGTGAFREELFHFYEPYEESVYCPTLSELIEACGDGFRCLEKCFKNSETKCGLVNVACEEDGWMAVATTCDFFAKTQEEAVANLYLSLHEKKE